MGVEPAAWLGKLASCCALQLCASWSWWASVRKLASSFFADCHCPGRPPSSPIHGLGSPASFQLRAPAVAQNGDGVVVGPALPLALVAQSLVLDEDMAPSLLALVRQKRVAPCCVS